MVEILDYGETAEGLVYSVMEFLRGQDLEDLLRAQPGGRLPWARAFGLLVQIASGLKAAHGQGVMHRDIKPANCFLTEEDGEPLVKLVDFGIAKLEGGDGGHTLTGTAQVLGTPSYIAPEMVRTKQPASAQSDVYSLGVVAYRMLVGRVPFSAPTVFELLRTACFDPVPSLRAQVPEIPAAVEALVMELLEEPEARPADMQRVRERLLALGRETLGAQAGEHPATTALPLSVLDSVPPPGLMDGPTVPRALRRAIAPTLAEAPGTPPGVTTEVLHLPTPMAVGGGAAHGVHDPGSVSSPSRSGETVPAVGEATLRGIESSGSIDSPRGRAAWWVLGSVVVLAMAGVLAVVPAMLVESETSPTSDEVAVVDAEPIADPKPVVDAEPMNAGAEPGG